MEKSECLKTYELVMVLDAHLPGPDKDAVFKDMTDSITKAGGKVIDQKVWIEKQRMAFAIKKVQDGTYHLTHFQASGAGVQNVRAALRLKEKILRSLLLIAK